MGHGFSYFIRVFATNFPTPLTTPRGLTLRTLVVEATLPN